MNSIFMNSKNCETSDRQRVSGSGKSNVLVNLKVCYTWKVNKFEFKFLLPEGSYSISNTQNYFEFIIKRCETVKQCNKLITYM